MSSLCTCSEKPNECPMIGHPNPDRKVDRSARHLVLHLAEQLGASISGRPSSDKTPVFFQDTKTGKIFQVDAVVRETGDGGDTIFMKGEEY